jgi:NitT/TauT family transport system ATP-binding protein
VLALAQAGGLAAVFVTHSVEEAVYMGSRVVVLSAGPGRITAELPVEGPLPRPPAFRATEAFRTTAEAVSRRLEAALA